MTTIEEETHKFFAAETERLSQEAIRVETVEDFEQLNRTFQVAMRRRREAFSQMMAAKRRKHEQAMAQIPRQAAQSAQKMRVMVVLIMGLASLVLGLAVILSP